MLNSKMSGAAGAEPEYGQDQLKVFSHEGDVDSLDLNDVKTELEEAADMAEVRVRGRGRG